MLTYVIVFAGGAVVGLGAGYIALAVYFAREGMKSGW